MMSSPTKPPIRNIPSFLAVGSLTSYILIYGLYSSRVAVPMIYY